MFDRRSLRYWMNEAWRIWLRGTGAAVFLWGGGLLLAPERYQQFLLTPAMAAFMLVFMNGLVTIMAPFSAIGSGCRWRSPLARPGAHSSP